MHAQLSELVQLSSVDILDESDELLKHKFQLVYAWGDQCDLESLDQRVMMVQHTLQVLCTDADVRAVLTGSGGPQRKGGAAEQNTETACMCLKTYPERFGSLCSIRLIQGAFMLLKKCFQAALLVPDPCAFCTGQLQHVDVKCSRSSGNVASGK